MSRSVSISRLARSAGLDPYELAVAMVERGIDISDPDQPVDGAAHKAARAVIRELLGGRTRVRAKTASTALAIEPAPRSRELVGMLSVEDVLFIHDRLCADFASTQDPIDPPGVRSMSLLGSAVSRQESGYGNELKYHEPVINAATLLYGICNDHPFYNGNKRTALVATLAHLDRNRLLVQGAKQRELYRFMVSVADHSVVQQPVKVGRDTEFVPRRGTPDEEVVAIAAWLRPRLQKITRGEASITYRELRLILQNFGFELHQQNRKTAICRPQVRNGLFRRGGLKTLMAIEWPGDGRTVGIATVKHIRRTLRLCEEDGVTREAFYSRGVRIDRFINDYRQVLRQLANR